MHSLSSVVEDAVRAVVAGVLVRVLTAVEKGADLVHPALARVALYPRLLLPETTGALRQNNKRTACGE